MVKINRTIKFIITLGIIVFIDYIMDVTSIFNKSVQIITSGVFGLKLEYLSLYWTTLYPSIAVVSSSNITILRKLEYSIGLFIAYAFLFAFYIFIYPYYSLYLNFIMATFPILLWVLLDKQTSSDN